MASMNAAVVVPCTGSAQSHCTACAAWKARQVLSAITPTPPGSSTTCSTPRIALAAVASKRFSGASMAGFMRTVAKTMPACRTSMPKVAVPVHLSSMSTRGMALPR